MIKDKTGAEIIRSIYEERKKEWHEHSKDIVTGKKPDLLKQYYSESFISCIGTLGRMVQYVGFDGDKTYAHWLEVMYCIIDMCILANKEPQFTLPENYIGYDFKHYQHCQRQFYIVHHMERMLNALTLGYEPLWWIEVGNEAGITDIKL